MIASFSNRFIFLKTRKTGGTSVEIVLSSWCVEGDVFTAISPEDEALRATIIKTPPLTHYKGQRVFNHMHATQVKALFPELWDSAYKFVVERHPYEKVVSRVFWNIGRRGGDVALEFDRELDETLEGTIFVDRDVYMIDGQIAVDEVIDYANMWDRLTDLGRNWGRSLPSTLPRAKGRFRTDRRSADEILTADQKKKIQKVAAFEFETYGYAP